MTTIGIIGPQGSNTWQAASAYNPDAQLLSFPHHTALARAFADSRVAMMILPVYNTRMGGVLKSFQVMERMKNGHWIDNIVQPIHLSLGTLNGSDRLKVILGTIQVIHQCEDFLTDTYPDISLLTVTNLDQALEDIKANNRLDYGVIEAEELLKGHGLTIREREIAPHNKTRYAVIGRTPHPATGYDATSILTVPLKDRVGMLFDTLGAFTQRGINILDMRAESDAKTQELQIFIEAEGHFQDQILKEALASIEHHVVQEHDCLKVLGSYPRVDMRIKRIKTFGFIGTGDMSTWFARKLENEGYHTLLSGRSTKLRPEEMIGQVDVVMVCVPISHTSATVAQYGKHLRDGQALILLAGEAEDTLNTAMTHTSEGVELMLVHNLWGPAALTMKDKNASVVRTPRSGALCSEFEAFLYKHGAAIHHDSPQKHDLLMGVGQKLPTTISVALAMALADNGIQMTDIPSHATLTSLYSILAMARVHNQNPRTYAEIMSTKGEGRKIVRSFAENVLKIMEMAEKEEINALCAQIDKSSTYLTKDFLDASMKQSLAVDKVLGKMVKS
ncbi:MAG: prephenate dehydrogenase/arogenate dehydrogenase family protein [Proteobacteria bacterium]|nr:prephenate dehydrogenase/arogenate dehydrogenase family protein [Pseudomonadota bacterium]MBU1639390.1 prephenate dehydrogenase/arogenate dehydrogenase family protein [Pseudomonadota bacterium]